MLTLANFNTTQAKTYYKRENYYSQEEAQANSEWRGQGVSQYQLSGSISDLDAYEKIVDGLSPDGKTQLRQKQNHKDKKERAGVDLTFSAPKSVSLACLVGGDSRLEEAHRNAVRRTIDLIEERYAFTRINDERVKTGNLTVAVWHHDTSRELDPHLHSHCLLMNCTQSPDGKWRTLSNEEFFRNKILLGQIYRNELALECKKLGYEIESHPKELFEIKGYTREQIEAFSKRHEQIKEKLAKIGVAETTENKIWVWRKTRVKKNHEIDRQEMLPYWHEEADLYDITHPIAINPNPQVVPPALIEIEAELVAAVQAGIEHCSERKVAFKSEDIEKFVTAETRPFGISKLREAISSQPELIKTFDGRYTTQAALARELATIKLMQQGKGAINPLAHPEAVEHYLEGKTLTQGQRKAIALTATTTDQFIAWQGVAGAGKTYALSELKQIATALLDVAPDYEIKGFASSAEAAKVLEEELGIEANTVARLVVSSQPEEIQPNSLWIVDEAGLLSAKAAYELLERATSERARVILVGDTRQLSAIEAGNPFKSLQQAGIQTAHLDESLRQKAPDLQLAVNLAAAGQITEAIAHLEQVNRIEEIPGIEERTNRIATEYIKLSPEERQNTIILAGTHKERSAIVKEIRAALKQEGTLGYGVEATQLRARQELTSIQTRYTHNYSVGDVVVPIREYRRSGLHKSQPYTVEAIAPDKLTLSDVAGNHLTVEPMKFRKTVYKQEAIEVAVEDRLKWTRNDKELGRRNGQEFLVTEIVGQIAFIQYLDGKSDHIDLAQPLHCDYALVSTTYSSQGKTAGRVLISSTVDRTVSQESVYVAISRAKHDLQIFAENREFLFEQARESNAQETVLELLQPQPLAQAATQSVTSVNQGVLLSVGVTEKPSVKRQEKSPTPNVEQPIKRLRIPSRAKATNLPRLTPKIERPKPLEAFWIPGNAPEAPAHIEENHWRELVEGSAIHPEIASRNFRSLQMGSIEQEHEAWEYLMYSDKLERTNTGRLSSGMLNKYTHIEAGGWWCSAGVDSRSFPDLQPGLLPSEQIWGCYKPNTPRENVDKPGKKIKYEHPPKTDLGIFLLDVPDDIADRIYQKGGVNPSNSDRERDFWYCVWKHNLPITITEGAKKAASLLSQGHAAIGLPGIYAGYRSKDEHGNPIKAHLHEELAVFATPEREICFCFDFETRPETKRNIEIAISCTGSLLKQKQSRVSVVSLPGSEKGVDDLIAAIGPLAYEQQHQVALPLQEWRTRNKQQQAALEPPKVLSVESRKLRIKAKLTLGQPINDRDFNKPKEPTHDNRCQQLETEHSTDGRESDSESNSTINQKDGAVRNHKYRTEQHDRAVEVKQRSTEREDYSSRSQPDRESERTEIQLHRVLKAISGYLELEEVGQQLGAFIAEINRSRAGEYVRDQRTEGIARPVERQSSAGIDSAASDGSIERQDGDAEQRATRQLLSALSYYLDAAGLSASPAANELLSLTENLRQHQNIDAVMQKLETAIMGYRPPETSRQALAAVTKFVEESCIEVALAGTLESVIGQLSSDKERFLSNQSDTKNNSSKEQPSIDQITSDQAINAISSYLEQQKILGSKITQDLATLTDQLRSTGVTASNQQIPPEKTEYLAPMGYEQITQRVIDEITRYIEAQTIEATPLEQKLEVLIDQLLQPESQEVAKIGQKSSLPPVESQPKVAKTKAIEIQTSQLLEALADYVEVAAVEAALVQPLETLIEGLHQHRTQRINNRQKNDSCSKAIADYIDQEAFELEILPVLENLVAELNTSQKDKSLPLISESSDPDIFEQAARSITDFIEQTAVESEITEVIEDLTRQLTLLKPENSTPVKKLDTAISHLLQQLEAIGARKQQETTACAVEAIVNYIDQEAVESVLNPQVLQTLTNQFEQLGEPKLTAAMRQLEAIAADYQIRLQTQAVKPIVKAIRNYCEHTTINEAIAQDIEHLAQNLSLVNKSELPKQFQQISSLIKQYHQQMEAQQTMNLTVIDSAPKQKLTNISRVSQPKLEAFKAISNWLRDMPLEEVAERLGLERDRHDKHKWKGVGQTISINNQKFYDHLALKGGYGAIDLVMHVQGRNFKESVDWLSNGISELPILQERSPQPKIPQERQPFQPPVPDEDKWREVRQYLVQKRGLPTQLVDDLHSCGKIYAAGLEQDVLEKLRFKGYSHPENITNAVFIRTNLANEATGASLRGVSEGSSFKGLATGSHRDNGWFSFTQGEGQLERIVLVESAIDAMSAAALAKHPRKTLFISTDGAGSVPVDWLQHERGYGIQIIAAHDADRTGEEMAWRLAAEIPAISRATPTRGKDWNEHLLSDRQPNHPETSSDPSEWSRVAQAIGKPVAYIDRIKAVTGAKKPLPEQAKAAMEQDFHAYKQTSSELWQWHQAAKTLGESEAYLKRIVDMAIAFHHPKQPTPLPEKAVASMGKDLVQHEQLLTHKQWQQYSQNTDPTRPLKIAAIVAYAAMKDGCSSQRIQKILEHDPEVTKIRQRLGEKAAQNHLSIAMQNAEYRRRSHNQQLDKKRQQKQARGLQL